MSKFRPANVIISERGPVLIDFGIAHPEDATSLTATGIVTGSPAWLSPEQANLSELTAASDVFSLGSLLAFAATGRPPFGQGATVAVLMNIQRGEADLAGIDPTRRALLVGSVDDHFTGAYFLLKKEVLPNESADLDKE